MQNRSEARQRNERKKFRKTRERKQKTRKGTKWKRKRKRKRGAPADCRKSLVPFKGVSIELAGARLQ